VSDDDGIFSEKLFYLRQHFFPRRRGLQIAYRESGDESHDMFQFISFLIRLDERLIFADDLSGIINLYDPYLYGLVLGDV